MADGGLTNGAPPAVPRPGRPVVGGDGEDAGPADGVAAAPTGEGLGDGSGVVARRRGRDGHRDRHGLDGGRRACQAARDGQAGDPQGDETADHEAMHEGCGRVMCPAP